MWHILIDQVDRGVALFCPSQIDGVFVWDGFEFGDLDHEVIEFFFSAEKVPLFDEYLFELCLIPTEDAKGELVALHLVNFVLTLHSKGKI